MQKVNRKGTKLFFENKKYTFRKQEKNIGPCGPELILHLGKDKI